MEIKQLKQELEKVLDEADGVDWHSNGEAYNYFDRYEAANKMHSITIEHMKGFAEFLANNSVWRNGSEGSLWYCARGLFKGDKTTEQLIELYFESLNK